MTIITCNQGPHYDAVGNNLPHRVSRQSLNVAVLSVISTPVVTHITFVYSAIETFVLTALNPAKIVYKVRRSLKNNS